MVDINKITASVHEIVLTKTRINAQTDRLQMNAIISDSLILTRLIGSLPERDCIRLGLSSKEFHNACDKYEYINSCQSIEL